MHRSQIPILILTVLAIGGLSYLIIQTPPYTNGTVRTGVVLLFLTLVFIALTGIFELISYPIKQYLQPYLAPSSLTKVSLRQGVLFAGCITTLLFLSTSDTFNILTAVLTILTFVAVEYFFH